MKVYAVETCSCEGGEVLGVCSTVEVAQTIVDEYLDEDFYKDIIEDPEMDKWNNNVVKMFVFDGEFFEPIVCITEWEVQEK